MDTLSKDEKKRIFWNELYVLKEQKYITSEHYEKTMAAYNKFHADLNVKDEQKKLQGIEVKKVPTPVSQAKKVEKKKLTPDEIRERNISWLLHIGVIFLLIGGLFVATSNWDTMQNWMKSGSISLVSFLFYGMAYVARKIIKIERTSFAFIILGSLFLPIFILSISWFGLLGPYLSFSGEGRYILGAAGSFFLFPIYAMFAKNLNSRFFVWFSYIALTIGVGYLLASFKLERDGFYFGMLLYNTSLAVSFHRLKGKEDLKLFTRELVYFVQINLILTTILMLAFFNSHVFYSVNVIITAAIYLSMVYVTGRKEFHFVFSIMVVYGVYQLIEYSVLEAFGPVLYVLVGAGFLFVPKVMSSEYHWEKVFRLTSTIVSCLAFIYISVEGLLLRMNEPSFILVFAYFILSVQFTYLVNVMKNKLFSYLSPIFVAAALYEFVSILDYLFDFANLRLPIFLIGLIIFIILGVFVKHSFIQVIKQSARDVGLIIMFLSIMFTLLLFDWLFVSSMLLLFSAVLLISSRVEDRSFYKKASPWVMFISFGFAFVFLGEKMRLSFSFYEENLGVAMNFILSGAALIFSSYFWKLKNDLTFVKRSFYLAQGFYTIAIFAAIFLSLNDVWMRPLALLAGVGMYTAFYKKMKLKWVPFLVAIVSLLTYYSILYALYSIGFKLDLFSWLQLPLGAIILLAFSWYFLKKDPLLSKGFSWVGHVNMPFTLLITFAVYMEKSMAGFLSAAAVYFISSRVIKSEWMIKLFLYSAFLSLFMVILTGFWELMPGGFGDFAFIITSVIVFLYWFTAKPVDKQRTMYFLIPFSLIGIFSFIASYPFGMLSFTAMAFYTGGIMVFLHLVKKDFLAGIPLMLLFIGTIWFILLSGMADTNKFMIVGGFGLILAVGGQLLYKKLLLVEGSLKNIDSYTFVAFLFFIAMYPFKTDSIWTMLLPGVLISTLLIFQRSRVKERNKWIPLILSGVFLLEPYYAVLGRLAIPDLISVEVNVLPFVAVIIFARSCLRGKFQKTTSLMQWAVLVITALILITDGMGSSTIYDALILGTLSLAAMLAGVFLRVKSYFFVGMGVLLLNVLLQTRPYWGNLPWWAYLLIVGSLLITVASYNEWHKQKTAKDEKTFISTWKKKIITKMKEWK